jgi:DNA-binding NtrC family response regulator
MASEKRVMIIDDDSDIRVFLFDLLTQEGYRVVTFENPLEALTRVHTVEPDLIILDLRMPQVSGLDFLPDLRMARPDTPVMMLTAYATPDAYLSAYRRGACELIGKPAEPATLLSHVHRLLRD